MREKDETIEGYLEKKVDGMIQVLWREFDLLSTESENFQRWKETCEKSLCAE